MTQKPLDFLFLDFDQTLFNHLAFMDWLDKYLSSRFNLDLGSFKNTIRNHRTPLAENLSFYEHVTHIAAVTGRTWAYVSGEIEEELYKQNLDFCFPEAHDVLEQLLASSHRVRILTFGHGDFQRFKLQGCKLLRNANIPVHVVDEPKGEFLGQNFSTEKGILVDDKYPLDLPLNWKHILVDRQNEYEKQKLNPGVIRIDSLNKLLITIEKEN